MKNHLLIMPATRVADKPLVEVKWKREEVKGKPLSSICLKDHSPLRSGYLDTLATHLKRNPKLLSQFVATLSKTFNSRLLSVHREPLTLVLCHRTVSDFRYMTENRQALIQLIRGLLPYQNNNGRLEVKVSFHGEEAEAIPEQQTKRLMEPCTHYRNRPLSKLDFDANEVEAIHLHFENISKKLAKQKANFDSRLQKQNEKFEIVKDETDKITKQMQMQLDAMQIRTPREKSTPSVDHVLSTEDKTSYKTQSSSTGDGFSSVEDENQTNKIRSDSSDKPSMLNKNLSPNSQDRLQGEDRLTHDGRNTIGQNANVVAASTKLKRTRREELPSGEGYVDADKDHCKVKEHKHHARDQQLVNQEKRFYNDDENEHGKDSSDDHNDDDNDIDDGNEEKEEVIDGLQKAMEELKERRARGEDTISTPFTSDPYYSRNSLLTSPSRLEHVLLRLEMDVTKETHPKLEEEHAAICTLNFLREVSLRDVPERIWRLVDHALLNEATPVPRSEKSFDTILCLDNYGNMARDTYSRLKEIALDFINGIEDNADEYGLEENIAVVGLGSSPQILHHLSIDYDSIRETIENIDCGGYPSLPYLQGVLMSLAALTRGGVCDLGGYLRVPPRLIVITDGTTIGKTGSCKTQMDQTRTLVAIAELGTPFVRQNVLGEVVVVPNGPVNEDFIKSSISKCKGKLVKDIASLCRNQRVKRHAAQILKYIDCQCGISKSTAASLDEILHAMTAGFKSTEKTEIWDIVKRKHEVAEKYSVNSFDNINEESNLPPLGTRVIRGPDWMYNDADGNGPGTVINHEPDKGNMWILWDNNRLIYKHCYGDKGYYDVCPVDDRPLVPGDSEQLVLLIGMQVERGPDWHHSYGDQDGGPGSYGTVIRCAIGRVMVRWNNGEMYEYRFGENYKYDLTIRSSYEKARDKKKERKVVANGADSRTENAEFDTSKHGLPTPSQTKTKQCIPTRWYWQETDGSWVPYGQEDNEKLIKTYARRADGSCLIKRHGENYRVLFKTLEEKPIDKSKGGKSRNVRFE